MKKFIMIAIIATSCSMFMTACGTIKDVQHASADTYDNDSNDTRNDYKEFGFEIPALETTTTAVTTTFLNVSRNLKTTSESTTTTTTTTTTSTTETSTETSMDETEVVTDAVCEDIYCDIPDNSIIYYRPVDEIIEDEYMEPSYEVVIPETTTTLVTTETTVDTTTSYVEESETVIDGTYLGNFRITGYVATGNKTASGTWPSAGRTIAMNNGQRKELGLSYGDQIYIDGLGTYTLEDSGCAYGRIDVFCNSVSECYALPPYLDAYLAN